MEGITNYVEKTYFKFPVKIYDPYSMAQSELEEEKRYKDDGDLVPVPVNYLKGWKLCIATDIKGIVENYHKGQPTEEVEHSGFPCLVITILEGDITNNYECTWNLATFEKALNEKMSLK